MRCPLLNKDCIEAKCAWWGEFLMEGKAGEGQTVEHDCVVPRIAPILIQIIKNTGQTHAATEQVRNRFDFIAKASQRRIAGGKA